MRGAAFYIQYRSSSIHCSHAAPITPTARPRCMRFVKPLLIFVYGIRAPLPLDRAQGWGERSPG
eukprot:6890590-Prymnesium_polylepis.1